MSKFFLTKVWKHITSACFLFLTCTMMVFAQQVTVTGTVSDESGAALPGVTILVQGTTVGAATDVNGRYTISGVSSQSVLIFSFVGFVTQEIIVGDSRNINVTLLEDSQQIEEVIVIGYGTRKAGELTGSVSVVRSDEIQKIPAVTAGEVLKNVPGLSVSQTNTPGSSPNVRVRGLGTINDTAPLWVVDGVPGATVNPNDIETVTILKDAASQAIYGTRAANGVILVTTKQGKKNERVNVQVNLSSGIRQNTNHYKLLNTMEYGQLIWLETMNDGRTPVHDLYGSGPTPTIPDYINPARGVNVDESLYMWALPSQGGNLITKANKEGTDWFDAIERTGKITDLSMTVSGGSDKTIYSFNLGYANQEGVLRYTGFDRKNLRLNVRTDVNKWVTVGSSLTASFSNQFGQLTANGEDSAISWAYRIQPIIPIYDVGGNFAGSRAAAGALGNSRNPLGILWYERDNLRQNLGLSGNVFANVNIIEGLQFRTLFGQNYNTYNQKFIGYYDISHSEGNTSDNVQMTHNYTNQWSWTNTLEYTKRFGKNEFTVMGSTEAINNKYYQTTARREEYPLRDPDYMDLTSGTLNQQNGSNRSEWAMFSIFGRLNYVYDSKYIFDAVVRRDGSSRFAAGNRYAVFPAFSASWVISRESFLASQRTWLDLLKIRVGYGRTGNDRMDNYNSFTTYSFQYNASQGTYYPISGSNTATQLGYRQATLGNTDVKWETTTATNLGFDVTLKMGLTVKFDVWQRRTTDMLYPKAIPQTMGNVTAPSLNVGEMLNNGFDLDMGYRGSALNRELRYRLNLNVSRYVNEIVKLSDNPKEFIEGNDLRQSRYTRTQKGRAFPEFFGYIVDGIFETQGEVDGWATYGSYNRVGRYKYRDIAGGPDGKPDGRITADDRTYIGSPHPKFVGSFNFNVEYKGFDLFGQFSGSYGNKMLNYVRRWLDYEQFKGGRSWESLYKSWGSPYLVGKATLPMAEPGLSQSQQSSTVFIEDASFLRLTNLQLGYNVGRHFNTQAISSLRVFIQVTNLFTITKYSGLDPETSQSSGRGSWINYGTDQGQWPTPRQCMFGVNLGL